MSTCWAIIIGINQYQGFQPLMQAQNDAVGIRRYLIDEAGFAPENCILLSDLSTSTEQEAVYPDRLAINDWLETICQGRVQSDDTLWFYFSGYGAQADNKDYLMPVDGDPAQVKQTGIALQDVVKHLKQSPTQNTMMVLDMNRSQSALAGQAIGEQVTKLANKARIPLILSCQPNEFSHETLAVRHGLFTAALLEGLRYDGCATLSHLERYLVERVPELCEHHWRPIQNPVVALPEEQKFRLLWHQRDTTAPDNIGPPAGLATSEVDAPDAVPLIPDTPDVDDFDFSQEDPVLIPDNPDDEFVDEPGLIPEPVSELILEDELPEEPSREPFSLDPVDGDVDDPDAYGTILTEELPDVEPKKSSNVGGCLGALGALVALLLLGAVLFRNQPAVKNALDQVPPGWLARVGLDPDGADGTDPATPDDTDADPTVDPNADPTVGEAAPGTTEDTEPPDNPDTETSEDPDAGSSDAEDPDAESPDAPDTDTPETVEAELDVDLEDLGLGVDEPDAATGDGETPDNPDTAASDASETPTTPTAASSNTVPTASSNTGSSNPGEDTAALLEEARRTLRPSQASRFASAIATARKIPPGDPNYNQAQADIQRWSRVILDLAQGRAAETELEAAINAAKLIPREPADVYQEAQKRISFWEARSQTRALIREAQTIPRMGQASTYQKGILKLQDVPSDQPIEHADAQRLIGEWTEKMLTIARARAAQGRYGSAIDAAALIPRNTPNYDQAQAEIKRWQGQ